MLTPNAKLFSNKGGRTCLGVSSSDGAEAPLTESPNSLLSYIHSLMSGYKGHDSVSVLGKRPRCKSPPDALKSVRGFIMCGLLYQPLRQPIYSVALAVANDVTVIPRVIRTSL